MQSKGAIRFVAILLMRGDSCAVAHITSILFKPKGNARKQSRGAGNDEVRADARLLLAVASLYSHKNSQDAADYYSGEILDFKFGKKLRNV